MLLIFSQPAAVHDTGIPSWEFIRWIGAGDAKFYAAAALAVPLNQSLALLMWSSVSGAAVLFAMIMVRKFKGEKVSRQAGKSGEVPFGVAIFIGFAITLSNALQQSYGF